MKIRKNLSDAEMFRGSREKLTFENSVYADEKPQPAKIKAVKTPVQKTILLPDEALERLNRFLLEISMEWLKNKNGDCSWKVTKENGRIIIMPAANKK
ncbi:MAG: hypothetical protein LUD24_00445 [Phascolarctobacterium sp.]|nr:hypothetical protein [Phascolarctobacterium sp.]